MAVDEHREIAEVFTSGAIQFFDLASGRPMAVDMPAQLTSTQVTAMASGAGPRAPGRRYGRRPHLAVEDRHHDGVLRAGRTAETVRTFMPARPFR